MPAFSLDAILAKSAVAAPLRQATFRNIWISSVISNVGTLVQGVGVAWLMTEMTNSPEKVALVQTSTALPTVLIAIGAGALADMFDRRIVCLFALAFSLAAASALAALTGLHLVNPTTLLILTFLIGCGAALMGPAWQASVAEQVPLEVLPQAIALNSISFNIARSFGPAVGGILVAAFGAASAFAANALSYIPLMVVFYAWRRTPEVARVPPEGFRRAMISGVRYLVFAPVIRRLMTRVFLTGVAAVAVPALLPLVTRNLLGGGAVTFGVMLGAIGLGAVIGALNIARIRARFEPEIAVRVTIALQGLLTIVIGLSRWPVVTALSLLIIGIVWMVTITMLNVGIQLSAPRWVAGRTLSFFQAFLSGGSALGAWACGSLATTAGVGPALVVAGVVMLLLPLIGLWLRMPSSHSNAPADTILEDPEVNLPVDGRSGPIAVEVRYTVEDSDAQKFHALMQDLQLIRKRNGASGWSIGRDIGRPEVWIERYQFPTWNDYLRHRNRPTQAEREVVLAAIALHSGTDPPHVTRILERPFGSVRRKEGALEPLLDIPPTPDAGV